MTKEEIKACIELNRKDFFLVRMEGSRRDLESKRVRQVLGDVSSLMKCGCAIAGAADRWYKIVPVERVSFASYS